MAGKARKKDQPANDRTEPVVLPDVATQPHPIVTVPEMPGDTDPDEEVTARTDAAAVCIAPIVA